MADAAGDRAPRRDMKLPDRSLLLFGKPPLAGSAKTRLAPELGLEGAARLYAAFLDDAVASALSLEDANAELWLSSGAGGETALADRYPRMTIREQAGKDLGERLRDAFAR